MQRRQWLMRTACGFGGLASGALLARAATAGQPPHFAPKAKRIIFLFMQGGVSHVDSFDYKLCWPAQWRRFFSLPMISVFSKKPQACFDPIA